jgi:amidase
MSIQPVSVTLPSARHIAADVRAGRSDPVEVVREHLSRIAQIDPQLHAFTVVREDAALDEAARLTRGDVSQLSLAGVPVAVKDSFEVAGLPTRHGSRATQSTPADRDSEMVRRLRAAGAIVIGKTTMPELAIWPFTEGPGWASRNPLDASRTCGGSSGGSAVAVATGMAALAVGTDSGGSIRIPAACCGVVGIKPSSGMVPLPGDVAQHWYGLTVAGPLARDVADASLLFGALQTHTDEPAPRAASPALRISLSHRNPAFAAPVDQRTIATMRRVAQMLRAAGHDVREDAPPYPVLPLPFLRCYLAGIAEDADALGLDINDVEPRTRAMVRQGRWIRRRGWDRMGPTYAAARRLRRWVDQRDAVLTPVLAYPPPRLGRWARGGWLRTGLSVDRWMGFNPPWNLAGCPVVVVPLRSAADARPVGVQIIGSPGAESRLLALAAHIEADAGARS